jgi:hypothetical protein
VTFWQKKNIGTKAAYKILMKLTTGINITNILRAAFRLIDPKITNMTINQVIGLFLLL